jgi:polyhydroxyalkanoate synthesis regulator protein
MPEDEVLLIEVRHERLYEAVSNTLVGRADIATMIATGRKYKVLDPETGEDVTGEIALLF